MDKGEFIKGGYVVRPTNNGGWIVTQGFYDRGYEGRGMLGAEAAFSNKDDLLDWLFEEHSLPPKSDGEGDA